MNCIGRWKNDWAFTLLFLLGCGGRSSVSGPEDGGETGIFPDDVISVGNSADTGTGGAGDAWPRETSTETCLTDSDCVQPSSSYCVPCFEGGTSCAGSSCVNGACQGFAAGSACPGPITLPCAEKMCGDACSQCSTPDGGCYPGTCTLFNTCKASVAAPMCSGAATRSCLPFDAVGVGDCNILLGWGWDGAKCSAVVGCICQGSDCPALIGAEQLDCQQAFFGCTGDGG
jgi:hypothetical protein